MNQARIEKNDSSLTDTYLKLVGFVITGLIVVPLTSSVGKLLKIPLLVKSPSIFPLWAVYQLIGTIYWYIFGQVPSFFILTTDLSFFLLLNLLKVNHVLIGVIFGAFRTLRDVQEPYRIFKTITMFYTTAVIIALTNPQLLTNFILESLLALLGVIPLYFSSQIQSYEEKYTSNTTTRFLTSTITHFILVALFDGVYQVFTYVKVVLSSITLLTPFLFGYWFILFYLSDLILNKIRKSEAGPVSSIFFALLCNTFLLQQRFMR